jgi:peptidyl-prolyl cis-trans isomerase A (cyclophilin A)
VHTGAATALPQRAKMPHHPLMKNRFALFAAPLMLALTAAAPAPKQAPVPDTIRVAIATEAGSIVVELDGKHAPVTTGNFLRYADEKRFDGTTFYRSMHLAWGDPPNGLIQAGTQNEPKRVLPPIAHEPTSVTGIKHKAGAISMARYAPGTASGDFSILLSDMPSLDADPSSANPEIAAGFAAFGHVVEGMDVVRRIWDAPRSPTKGVGVMKGQMLEPPIRVLTVRRVPASAAPLP